MDDMDIRAGIIQQVIDAIRGRVDEEAAAVLGHTDLRNTQIYCYISQTHVKSAYRKYAA